MTRRKTLSRRVGGKTIKKPLNPAVIAGVLVVVAIVAGFFLLRAGGGGAKTEGVESMPPDVRKAFMGANGNNPAQKKP